MPPSRSDEQGDEARTRNALDEAGRMRTGDLATMDERGYVNIVGCLKEHGVRYIEFVDEFPMTITGKIQKFVMREQTIKKLGLKTEKTA